jgi:GxxExxY protein
MAEFYYRDLSNTILNACYKVHTALGPGLFEEAYETCLEYELLQLGLTVQRQLSLSIVYEGLVIPNAYRLDLLINGCIVIELKSVANITDLHYKQLFTYMRLSQIKPTTI